MSVTVCASKGEDEQQSAVYRRVAQAVIVPGLQDALRSPIPVEPLLQAARQARTQFERLEVEKKLTEAHSRGQARVWIADTGDGPGSLSMWAAVAGVNTDHVRAVVAQWEANRQEAFPVPRYEAILKLVYEVNERNSRVRNGFRRCKTPRDKAQRQRDPAGSVVDAGAAAQRRQGPSRGRRR